MAYLLEVTSLKVLQKGRDSGCIQVVDCILEHHPCQQLGRQVAASGPFPVPMTSGP